MRFNEVWRPTVQKQDLHSERMNFGQNKKEVKILEDASLSLIITLQTLS